MTPPDTIRVENVVASSGVEQELSLTSLATDLPGADYNPDRFPGLVYRTHGPDATSLVFRSGEIVTTGAESEAAIHDALDQLFEQLAGLGIAVPDEPAPTVQNIVSSADLDQEVNLNAIAVGLGLETVEYEPEQFPGLIYRLDDPSVVVLLFGTGKVVITGATRCEDAHHALETVREQLTRYDLLA